VKKSIAAHYFYMKTVLAFRIQFCREPFFSAIPILPASPICLERYMVNGNAYLHTGAELGRNLTRRQIPQPA
jgi:hypothetical protein